METTRTNHGIDEMSFYIYTQQIQVPYYLRFMVFAFVVFVTIRYVSSDLDMTPKDVLCDPESYEAHNYVDSIAYVLKAMANVTANRSNYSYTTHTEKSYSGVRNVMARSWFPIV